MFKYTLFMAGGYSLKQGMRNTKSIVVLEIKKMFSTFKINIKNTVMKKTNPGLLAALLFTLVTLSSCEAIAGIFKAGMWFGIIGIIVVVIIIFWLIGKARK